MNTFGIQAEHDPLTPNCDGGSLIKREEHWFGTTQTQALVLNLLYKQVFNLGQITRFDEQ